jgi:hypothetical protein
MNDNLIHPKDKPADESIVIPDECGDSMWEAVLSQEARKACDVKEISTNVSFCSIALMQHKSATQQ